MQLIVQHTLAPDVGSRSGACPLQMLCLHCISCEVAMPAPCRAACLQAVPPGHLRIPGEKCSWPGPTAGV